MTEQEWLACADPQPMLGFLRDKASDRKLRLFACACCRRIWRFLQDERSRAAVAASERFADKQIRRAELVAAQQQAMLGKKRFDEYVHPAENAAASVARPSIVPRWVAQLTARAVGNDAVWSVAQALPGSRANATSNEAQCQAALLREIFGNPFRPVAFDPIWLTSNVVALARPIYDEKTFDHLPILADALEDAGCTNQDILDHCRQPGEHVRGCWALDLILGRE